MKHDRESGLYVVPDKNERPIDNLHACVCPNCGMTDIDKIACYPDYMGGHWVRCFGGFGIKKYTWMPHMCKACGEKFVAWEAHKELNPQVMGDAIGVVVTVLVSAILATLSLIKDPRALGLVIPVSAFTLFGIFVDMHSNTYDQDDGIEGCDIDIDSIPTEDESSEKENEHRSLLLNNLASACVSYGDPLNLGISGHYYIGGNNHG